MWPRQWKLDQDDDDDDGDYDGCGFDDAETWVNSIFEVNRWPWPPGKTETSTRLIFRGDR